MNDRKMEGTSCLIIEFIHLRKKTLKSKEFKLMLNKFKKRSKRRKNASIVLKLSKFSFFDN